MNWRIRRIQDPREFMAFGPLWSDLASSRGHTSPFASYDWFWCCWHGVWPRFRPEILVLEDAGAPAAIIPLMHWKRRLRGLPVRHLGFLTYANAPIVDLITVSEHEHIMELLLDHLASRSDWDVVSLQRLPAASRIIKDFEKLLPERGFWQHKRSVSFPYYPVDGDWQGFYNSKDRATQKIVHEVQAKLERAGSVSVEVHRTLDPWSPCLHEVLEIIQRSSNEECLGEGTSISRLPEFLRELTRRAARNGWLSLWILRLNGRAIAMEFQLRSDGKVQALWTGSDPAYRDLSPTHALHLIILQTFFEHGDVYEYCMPQCSNKEPRSWATGSQEVVHLKFFRPSLYSPLLYRLETSGNPGVSQ